MADTIPTAGEMVRCWACNYILHGLESRRCPECGREFDPDKPATMNRRRAIGPTGRAIMGRTWWLTVLLAAAATGAIAFSTRWPAVWAGFSLVDIRFYAPLKGFPRALDLRTPADVAYSAALYLWLIVGTWWLIWLAPRLLMRWRFRPPLDLWPAGGRRDLAIAVLLLISCLMAIIGWPRRLAQHTYSGRKTMVWHWIGAAPGQPRLAPAQQWMTIRAGLLDLPRSGRAAAIQDAVNAGRSGPLVVLGDGLPLLLEAVRREEDQAIRVAEVHIIGLYRDPATADFLLGLMSHPDSETRAAAADALGVLRKPSYEIPNRSPWDRRRFVLAATGTDLGALDPAIYATPYGARLLGEPRPVGEKDVPPGVRSALERMMLQGPTREEREAAARALVAWPPENYRLRLAEWGVWFNIGGELKLVQSVIDEIPPFVHRTGNSDGSFSQRINQAMFITKPVIHVTADRPMAVDMEVQIFLGRPWFAYPRPDDFGMTTYTEYGSWKRRADGSLEEDPAESLLHSLNNPQLPPLDDLSEGYPWLRPNHREYGAVHGGSGAIGNKPMSLGLRWQSLIVSPQKLPWMNDAQVGSDPRFAWWQRLRNVRCSWVANRGESERFLYYDGPSLHRPACGVALADGKLNFTPRLFEATESEKRLRFDRSRFEGLRQPAYGNGQSGSGLYIDVQVGAVRGQAVSSPLDGGSRDVSSPPLKGAAVEAQLLEMVKSAGLRDDEALALIESWRPHFFQTPGRRHLQFMAEAEYDLFCPIQVRPVPTELVRVGIVVTEFDAPTTRPGR